jgi:hypothetical protein
VIPTLQLGQFGRTGSFRAPVIPFANVILLLRGEASPLVDESASPKTVTEFGGITTTSTTPLSETSSILCDGVNDYAQVGSAANWNFGGSDHSIELKVRMSSIPGGQFVALSTRHDTPNGSGFDISFNQPGSGGLAVDWYNGSGSVTRLTAAAGTFSANVNYDLGIFRDSGVWRLFIDGQLRASTTISLTFQQGVSTLSVGALNNGSPAQRFFPGRIEARIANVCGIRGVSPYLPDAAWPTS